MREASFETATSQQFKIFQQSFEYLIEIFTQQFAIHILCAFIHYYIILCIGWIDDVSDELLMTVAMQAEMDHYGWHSPTDTTLLEMVNSIEEDEKQMELENVERKKRARSLQRGKQPRKFNIL